MFIEKEPFAVGFGWAVGRGVLVPCPSCSHLIAVSKQAHLGVDQLSMVISVEVSAHSAVLTFHMRQYQHLNSHCNRIYEIHLVLVDLSYWPEEGAAI